MLKTRNFRAGHVYCSAGGRAVRWILRSAVHRLFMLLRLTVNSDFFWPTKYIVQLFTFTFNTFFNYAPNLFSDE